MCSLSAFASKTTVHSHDGLLFHKTRLSGKKREEGEERKGNKSKAGERVDERRWGTGREQK